MNNENGQRGACDRCRGQKLRCVGSGKPIFDSTSRFLRNEIPCDRCKRAKVDCYSVRPASRRPADSDRNLDQRTNTIPPSSEKSSFSHHHRGSVSSRPKSQVAIGPKPQQNDLLFSHPQRSNSVAPHSTKQNDRQSRDPDLQSTMPTISNEWMTYLHEDEMEGHDLGLETPPWIESNLNTCQDPVTDEMGDHNMVDLMNQAPSVEWDSDQFELDMYTDQIEPPNPASSKVRKLTSPDRGVSRPGQTRRSSQMSTQTPESTKSCLQELAKFNEMLLREKSSLEDASTRFKSNRRSIGQTLHHCQEFFSILKGIKYSCPASDSSGGRAKSDWSFLADGRLGDVQSQARQSIGSAPSCSYGSTFSSSGRSLSISLTTPSLEIPTLLSILFCYTYLLQSYDDLFISILDAVTQPTPTIPPILSGLRIDGFELDGHNTLQLECLINVSYNLLEKIENILIGSTGYGGLLSQAKGDFLGDKLFAGLIDALYEPNEQNSLSHGNGKREVRAKRLMREIQAALKAIDL